MSRTFGPTAGLGAGRTMRRMQLDLGLALLFLFGIAVAVGLAVLAGSLSARIFYRASRVDENDR